METEIIGVEYSSALDLMHDLKRLGARNINQGRRRSLTGKQRLQKMLSAYEKHRRNDRLPATYEIVYGHAWAPPAARAKRIDENTVAFPLAGLKRRPAGPPG